MLINAFNIQKEINTKCIAENISNICYHGDVIAISGELGSGKSTFAYHFINFLLSKNEEKKYSVENFNVNSENKSYKFIDKNIHPNFYVINSNNEDNIKIEEIKNTLKFLNKSSYNSIIKIVLLDNAEYLNLHSSNALLHVSI